MTLVLGEADQSQAEARVVSLLANDYEMLEAYDKIDTHKLVASWFFGEACVCKKTKAEPDETCPVCNLYNYITEDKRFTGKTGRHMGNLGAGKNRFMIEVNTNARKYNIRERNGDFVSISERRAGEILQIFHKYSPKIRQVFHKQIRTYLEEHNKVLISPHGRRRQFFDRFDSRLLLEANAFIPQATVSDKTKIAMLNLKKRKPYVKIVLEAHDAFVWIDEEREFEETAIIVKEIMEEPIDFERCSLKRGILKIPCDIKVGYNYKDLKKYEVK